MGRNVTSLSRATMDSTRTSYGGTPKVHQGTRPYNKAGAADEHTVVRGKDNGAVITAVTVSNHEAEEREEGDITMNSCAHFNDPPRLDNLDESEQDIALYQEHVACMNADAVDMHEDAFMEC